MDRSTTTRDRKRTRAAKAATLDRRRKRAAKYALNGRAPRGGKA